MHSAGGVDSGSGLTSRPLLRRLRTWYILPLLLLLAVASAPAADVPGIIAYQGRIATGSGPFTGTGSFKFALVDQAGTTTWWSHDGTSVAGAEPTGAVLLGVQGGLFAVLLGDPGHAGMTQVVPPAAFNNSSVHLRIWFSASGTPGTFELLAPDRRLASAGYAFLAHSVADGAIGDAQVSALAWSKLTGVPALVRDAGSTPAILSQAGNPVAAPASGTGTLCVATTSQSIYRWDGAVWQLIAAATVGSVGDGTITTVKLADGAVTDAKVSDVAWSKLSGVPSLVANAGTTPAIASGAADPVGSPASGVGTLYVATTSQSIFRWSGSAWQLVSAVSAVADGSITGAKLADGAVDLAGTKVTGTLPIANGGTGATSAAAARANLGLGNVDDTSDANKPVSTATATALSGKLSVASNLSDVANAATARTNLGLGNVQDVKVNLTAVAAPAVTNDSGSGYGVGSLWVDTSADQAWICLDASVGAAVWNRASLKDVITSGTYTKVTVDAQGRVTGSSTLAATDIPDLDAAKITSGQVAIAQGGTGAATAGAAFNALSPTTTKGDLVVRDASGNIRLPVGANGEYLMADSTQASGVRWTVISGTVPNGSANGDMMIWNGSAWVASNAAAVKTNLSLNNVDNTSDANKPVSTATATALSGKVANGGGVPSISAGLYSALPGAGTAGVLYYATDTNVLYRDTGSVWVALTVADGGVTAGKIASGAIVNADVSATAAIAGTKISPDFGNQNVATTGNVSAANVTGNGANALGLATNGAERMRLYADGGAQIGGTYGTSPGAGSLQVAGSLKVGTGSAGDSYIYAWNADANRPAVRYDDTANAWQLTNDGTTWSTISNASNSLSGSGAANRVALWSGASAFTYSDSLTFSGTDLGVAGKLSLGVSGGSWLTASGDPNNVYYSGTVDCLGNNSKGSRLVLSNSWHDSSNLVLQKNNSFVSGINGWDGTKGWGGLYSDGWPLQMVGVGLRLTASGAGDIAISTGNTPSEKVRIYNDGGVQIGGTFAASPGPGVLKTVSATVATELVLPEKTSSPVTPAAGSLRYNATAKIVEFWEPTAGGGSGAWVAVNTYAP